MKHSKQSIKKAVNSLRDEIRVARMNPEKAKLHISKGNRKIGLVHNFSIAPIITCSNCSGCKDYCYDIKAVLQYKNVLKARAENTALMLEDMSGTFERIADYISRRRVHKFFRWHVSGDIINYEYFEHMVEIARMFPDWIFWTYTKAYAIVNLWLYRNGRLPDNLTVMFSVWNGMDCPNPHNMPTFTCIQDGMEPDPNAWNCPGNCTTCIESGHGCPHGESSQVREH